MDDIHSSEPDSNAPAAASGSGGSPNPFLDEMTAKLADRLAARGEELRIQPDAEATATGSRAAGGDSRSASTAKGSVSNSTRSDPSEPHGSDPAAASTSDSSGFDPTAAGCDALPSDGTAAGELAALIASVAGLAAAEPATLSPQQRMHLTVALADAKGRLDALLSSAIGAVNRHLDYTRESSRTPAVWLASHSELTKQQAAHHNRLHRELIAYSALRDAWEHGQLGTTKIRLLLDASEHIGSQLQRDQTFLVDTLAPLTVEHAATAINRWREHALGELDQSPEDPEPTPADNTLTSRAGANRDHIFNATLDRRTGHEFERLLEAETTKRFQTGDYHADDGLTPTARRADALMRLMRRGLETKTEFGRLRPSTVNIIDLTAILGLSPKQIEDICFRPRETENGDILTAYQLLDDYSQGNLTTVLGFYGIEGRFHPVGAITTNRLPSAAQRRILQIRDGHCMHPGCDQPAPRCNPHHEPPYEISGRTTINELVLLCRHHHKLRHQNKIEYRLDANGDLTTTTGGQTHPPTRPGRKLPAPEPEPPNRSGASSTADQPEFPGLDHPPGRKPRRPPGDRQRTRRRSHPPGRDGPPDRTRNDPAPQTT